MFYKLKKISLLTSVSILFLGCTPENNEQKGIEPIGIDYGNEITIKDEEKVIELNAQSGKQNFRTEYPTVLFLLNFTDIKIQTPEIDYFQTIFENVSKYWQDTLQEKTFLLKPVVNQCGLDGIFNIEYNGEHTGQEDKGEITEDIRRLALTTLTECSNIKELDTNNNGIINSNELQIFYSFAGYENAWSTKTPSVWASAGNYPNIFVNNFLFSGSEMKFGDIGHKFGVIVHETAHSLLHVTDLYHRDDGTHNVYDLMGAGAYGMDINDEHSGDSPTQIGSFIKKQSKFYKPYIVTKNETLNLYSNMNPKYKFIQINNPLNKDDYYLIELRSAYGPDKGITKAYNSYNGGIIIEHIYPSTLVNDGYKVELLQNNLNLTGFDKKGNFVLSDYTTMFYENDIFSINIDSINHTEDFYEVSITLKTTKIL